MSKAGYPSIQTSMCIFNVDEMLLRCIVHIKASLAFQCSHKGGCCHLPTVSLPTRRKKGEKRIGIDRTYDRSSTSAEYISFVLND